MRIEKETLLGNNEKSSNQILELEEKVKVLESSEKKTSYDDSLILKLESQVNALNERNKSLNITCAQITRKFIDYLKQIKELEEDKRKSLSMLAQGSNKFEKILTMGRHHRDKGGLGFNSNFNHTSSSQKIKNVLVKAKGKVITHASHKDKEKYFLKDHHKDLLAV